MSTRFLVILICFGGGSSFGQDKSSKWNIGFFVEAGVSKWRNQSGYVFVYPGAPLWAGDLKVESKIVPAYSFGINQEKSFGTRGFTAERSVSFSSLGYLTTYDYDYANSINNIVQSERNLNYLAVSQRVKFNIKLADNFSLAPSVSVFLSYLVKSKETNTNYFGGDFISWELNYLPYEKRFNYGYEGGLSARFKATKFDYELRGLYRSYYREHYNDKGKKVHALVICLAFIIKR